MADCSCPMMDEMKPDADDESASKEDHQEHHH
jgi:hypothetical protein